MKVDRLQEQASPLSGVSGAVGPHPGEVLAWGGRRPDHYRLLARVLLVDELDEVVELLGEEIAPLEEPWHSGLRHFGAVGVDLPRDRQQRSAEVLCHDPRGRPDPVEGREQDEGRSVRLRRLDLGLLGCGAGYRLFVRVMGLPAGPVLSLALGGLAPDVPARRLAVVGGPPGLLPLLVRLLALALGVLVLLKLGLALGATATARGLGRRLVLCAARGLSGVRLGGGVRRRVRPLATLVRRRGHRLLVSRVVEDDRLGGLGEGCADPHVHGHAPSAHEPVVPMSIDEGGPRSEPAHKPVCL